MLDGQVRAAYEGYAFADVVRHLADFCSNDLSALFFDIRRDALYCDLPSSLRRRACRTVMDAVFERLTIWLAPLIPFTMEEAWMARFPDGGLNGLRVMPETPKTWRERRTKPSRWSRVELVTRVGHWSKLEESSGEKNVIGAALEAAVTVYISELSDDREMRSMNLDP